VTHLDTAFIVDLLREQARGARGPAHRLLDGLSDEELAVPVFVACELEAGAARAANPERERTRVRALLDAIPTVFPGEGFAATYGDLLNQVHSAGRSIAVMDLLIATGAVAANAALATPNHRHFEVVPGLTLHTY
jgi:predicted nucleic acid-binding protein